MWPSLLGFLDAEAIAFDDAPAIAIRIQDRDGSDLSVVVSSARRLGIEFAITRLSQRADRMSSWILWEHRRGRLVAVDMDFTIRADSYKIHVVRLTTPQSGAHAHDMNIALTAETATERRLCIYMFVPMEDEIDFMRN